MSLWQRQEIQALLRRTHSAVTRAPDNLSHVQKLVEQAFNLQQQGNLQSWQSSLLIRRWCALPHDAGLLGFKGWLAFEQGRVDEAEKTLNNAIALNPDDSRLYNFLGQVLDSQDQLVEAERAFGRAITLRP